MDNNRLIIIGIDPGTTTAYAALDLNGNLIEIKSSKNFGLNSLLSDIINLGKVVVVGTDKAKIPNLIYQFSAKTGSKIIYPKEDLIIEEKRKLTQGIKTDDVHQSDALASSLFALNKIRSTLLKINEYVSLNNKAEIKNKIIGLVLTKDLGLREAVDLIENLNKKETRIIEKVVEKRELKQNDFMKLYRMVKRYEKEIYLLKRQNNNLKKTIKGMERDFRFLNYKLNSLDIIERADKKIRLKEKNIYFLESEIKKKNEIIKEHLEKIKVFNNYLSRWNEIFILKKLDNLGSSEFLKKRDLLNISKDDILLVNDPNIISKNITDYLKDKVNIIVSKIPASSKIKKERDFLFIDNKRLRIEENEFFGIVNRNDINDLLKNEEYLQFIIDDYKKSRKTDISIT